MTREFLTKYKHNFTTNMKDNPHCIADSQTTHYLQHLLCFSKTNGNRNAPNRKFSYRTTHTNKTHTHTHMYKHIHLKCAIRTDLYPPFLFYFLYYSATFSYLMHSDFLTRLVSNQICLQLYQFSFYYLFSRLFCLLCLNFSQCELIFIYAIHLISSFSPIALSTAFFLSIGSILYFFYQLFLQFFKQMLIS